MTSQNLRSRRWFAGSDVAASIHRWTLRAQGMGSESFDGRPVVGICNSWSELTHCNVHFRALADAVKRGVLQAGGVPLEFPTISLSEPLMKPTSMLYRNLMAMDVEESLRAHPFDAVVLLGGCDKTTPAMLMGGASADIPAIILTGGPSLSTRFQGRTLGSGTDFWKYTADLRAGRISRDEYEAFEQAIGSSAGHCPEMGSASTMAAIVEVLGMGLPGGATAPAVGGQRLAHAEATGRQAVAIAGHGPRPSSILTSNAFHNALTLLAAIGGSTNAVLHLLALARRLGVPLSLVDVERVARATPRIVDLRPAGAHLMEDLHHAGGIPAVLRELEPLLHRAATTVFGRPLVEQTGRASGRVDTGVIATLDQPFAKPGGLAVLHGNLAPGGALIKASAASDRLMRHEGEAVVFDSVEDLTARIDDLGTPVRADSVLVLRNVGPVGGPGMPEVGQLPLPRSILRSGVSDMVRLSDARMSGTAYGTVILHVAPEAAVGGPLAVVHTGDRISLDVEGRRLDLLVSEEEIAARLRAWRPKVRPSLRGYAALYERHVRQADEGCDFDFLEGGEATCPRVA